MALAVSLILEFKSPIDNMDCFEKMKVISQGLGLATPARAAIKPVGPNTISISKMVCDPPTYNKLMKLLRPEDATAQDLLARYEMYCSLSPKTSQLQYGQPDPALENLPHKPCVVEAPKAPSSLRSYAPPTSSVATKQLTTISKRSTPDETGRNDYPSKRLKTMHNPAEEVEYLLHSLLEKVGDLEVAKENEGETKQPSRQGKILELETKLANEEQEAKSVTRIEESRRLLSGIVSEIRTRLLAKEKELYSITQALNEEKHQNTLLLKELNKKNDASEVQMLKNNERSARETIEDLQQKLNSEHDLRSKAEKLVDDIRRELKFPFIVPSLLDAFIIFSESNIQIPATLSTNSG
ncbi:hypothetical protein Clacol_005569 [Clathrus columnatus]|uniref:Uncharacterized protein n=1 Tax=Clathrus columnatus TaxID=1419009 RepID=A0AAV5ACL8_9AGAM|nr:hypothetical protein Clacol_005569 [Clathrus columnatus]